MQVVNSLFNALNNDFNTLEMKRKIIQVVVIYSNQKCIGCNLSNDLGYIDVCKLLQKFITDESS